MQHKVIPIVLTCDDSYIKYACVTISSIMANSSSKNSYEIIIISDHINENNQSIVKDQIAKKSNFSIRFVCLEDIDLSKFYLNSYMTAVTYYRFYIPDLLPEYGRVLYLDCDLVVNIDVAVLFDIEIGNHISLCVKDGYIQPIIDRLYQGKITQEIKGFTLSYCKDVLHLSKDYPYFNAGVMLLNISLMREIAFSEKLFSELARIGKPIFQDQDILNSCICQYGEETEGLDCGYLEIDHRFNAYGLGITIKRIIKLEIFRILALKIKKKLYIQHYVGCDKPWQSERIGGELYFRYLYNRYTPSIVISDIEKGMPTEIKRSKMRKLLYRYIF